MLLQLDKMEKKSKAQGHIEIMLSIILFVGVIIAIFIFINPFGKTEDKTSIADKIQRVIMERVSEDVGKLSVVIPNPPPLTICYKFITSDYLSLNRKEIEVILDKKYDIYFADFLNFNSPHFNPVCPNLNYKLGVYAVEKMIVHDKITDLKQLYDTDYTGLKNTLGITNDFMFSFKEVGGGGEVITPSNPKRIPRGVEVKSKEFSVRIINPDAEIKEYVFNLMVW